MRLNGCVSSHSLHAYSFLPLLVALAFNSLFLLLLMNLILIYILPLVYFCFGYLYFSLKIYLVHAFKYFAFMYVSVTHGCNTYGGQKKVSSPLELEL